MKIWIHINGVQEGPYELQDLPLDRMDALTPVWHEGLPAWQPASQVPLVANFMAGAAQQQQQQFADQQQQQQQYAAQQQQWQQQQYAAQQQQQWQQQWQQPQEKAPASYLAWSIVMTVLCCNPIGIVPIITGASTRSRYNNRDFDGARRMSETTAWWVMITIVTSLMFMPLAILM